MSEIIEIKELNTEIIPPLTSKFGDPKYKGGSKLVVIGKPGCFSLDTPVMMYNGSLKMVQDVCVGDMLMGDDSTPRKVLELCRNEDEMFEIRPAFGVPYTVNKQHKLVLCNKNDIKEITVDDYLKNPLSGFRTYRKTVLFKRRKVDVEAYEQGLNANIVDSDYIYNDIDTRFNFLAGVIDNLDSMTRVESYNELKFEVPDEMGKDMEFLTRTLGFVSSYESGTLNLRGPIGLIPARSVEFKNLSTEYDMTSSFEVIHKGYGQYYGFTIDGNHRFLLGSCDVVRNTGKSKLIKALLHSKKHIFPVGLVMSGSEDSNHEYAEYFPDTFIFNEYNEDKIQDFIQRQKIAMEYLTNPYAVLILDDCTDDPKLFNKPLQHKLYKYGRHWCMMYILSLQYAMDVKPAIRTNVDGVFILREPLLNNREGLYRNYASIIPTFELFCELMDKLTEDHHAMFILNAVSSNRWQDCVFYWKAPLNSIPSNWKFGSREYWDFHYNRYNENYTKPFNV